MLNEGMCLGAAEGASLLRRGSSRSGRPPKIILAGFGFSLGQLASGRWGAILSPHAPWLSLFHWPILLGEARAGDRTRA